MTTKELKTFLENETFSDNTHLQIALYNDKGEFVGCMIVEELRRSELLDRCEFVGNTRYAYKISNA